MKNRKIFMCGAFAFLAASLAGGTIAFGANAESETKAINEIGINMEQGASMRIATAGENNAATTGLRFTMKVSKSDYKAVDLTQYDGIEWGMLIAPVESVKAAEFTEENLFGASAKYVFNRELTSEDTGKYAAINVTETELTLASETNLKIENASEYYVFSGYMHTIKEENLTRGFVGRGYVKYTVKGEETPQYKFAEYFGGDVENNTRSAYYVAAKYVADNGGTDAANYVKTTYLENAAALATANVNITANDYDEDITIGTYKTEVSATNTVTAKIGEKYDLTAEENAKTNYTLRTDLSSTAEPVYRGQELSIKRYYESNDYIPFSKTAGAVSLVEEEGETKGAYKYSGSSGTTSLLLVSYTNAWDKEEAAYNDKITRNKATPDNLSVAGYVNLKIRWSDGSGGFNLISQLGASIADEKGSLWRVSSNWFNSKGTTLGGLVFYKESGYPVKRVEPNVWYKVALPVYTNFTSNSYNYKFGSAALWIDDSQTVYFKEVEIADKDIYADQVPTTPDPDGYNPIIGSNGKKEWITEEGDVQYSTKYTINTSASYGAALRFGDTSSAIYSSSVKYITAEIRFENVSVFWTRDQLGYENSVDNYFDWRKIGTDYATTDATHPVLFYDMDGNSVTTVQNDTWYKVAIPVKAKLGHNWGELIMQIEFVSPNTSAAVYLRNTDYGSTNIYA